MVLAWPFSAMGCYRTLCRGLDQALSKYRVRERQGSRVEIAGAVTDGDEEGAEAMVEARKERRR